MKNGEKWVGFAWVEEEEGREKAAFIALVTAAPANRRKAFAASTPFILTPSQPTACSAWSNQRKAFTAPTPFSLQLFRDSFQTDNVQSLDQSEESVSHPNAFQLYYFDNNISN